MAAHAKLKFVRIPPRKARYVVDQIRGKSVAEAERVLMFSPRRAAKPLLKLLRSAVANAEQQGDLDPEILFVRKAHVDQGPAMKRIRPRAQGRAFLIRHRTSHVTVEVDER